MRLAEALDALQPLLGDALVVHANGHIARQSFTLQDRPGNFYMIGSMGLASSIGLGIALCRPERRVVVLDGDGNLLMNLGALATIAAARPRNLAHIVLDNGVYASTGNQPAISRHVPLEAMAIAAGYASGTRVESPAALADAFDAARGGAGPAFILARIEVEQEPFTAGRVTHTPVQIRDRFIAAAGAPTANL